MSDSAIVGRQMNEDQQRMLLNQSSLHSALTTELGIHRALLRNLCKIIAEARQLTPDLRDNGVEEQASICSDSENLNDPDFTEKQFHTGNSNIEQKRFSPSLYLQIKTRQYLPASCRPGNNCFCHKSWN